MNYSEISIEKSAEITSQIKKDFDDIYNYNCKRKKCKLTSAQNTAIFLQNYHRNLTKPGKLQESKND